MEFSSHFYITFGPAAAFCAKTWEKNVKTSKITMKFRKLHLEVRVDNFGFLNSTKCFPSCVTRSLDVRLLRFKVKPREVMQINRTRGRPRLAMFKRIFHDNNILFFHRLWDIRQLRHFEAEFFFHAFLSLKSSFRTRLRMHIIISIIFLGLKTFRSLNFHLDCTET